ncbi:MAG: hypothetical protein Q7J54_06130 [Candidatus Woesearchaeota archaeon]|nr:hypothetical protein [Candidatus Woesearchaeota archaeon]
MLKILNNLPNFGITLDELFSFRSRPKANPGQNYEALSHAIDGIELFEVPRSNLGVPLEMLQHMNPANILSYYTGLGRLITKGAISYKGQEIEYEMLLKENPPHIIVSRLVGYGYKYNAIIKIKNKMLKRGVPKEEIKQRMLYLFIKNENVKKEFMHSLREARKTRYYKDVKKPIYEEAMNKDKLSYIENLVYELYATKTSKEYLWKLGGGKVGRRMKTRSESEGRKGNLYFTWDVKGNYNCTCPARVECKHIKELKAKKYVLKGLLPEEQELGKNVVSHRHSEFRDPLTMNLDEITNEAGKLATIQEKLKLEGGSPEYARILDRLRRLKDIFELKRRSEI